MHLSEMFLIKNTWNNNKLILEIQFFYELKVKNEKHSSGTNER